MQLSLRDAKVNWLMEVSSMTWTTVGPPVVISISTCTRSQYPSVTLLTTSILTLTPALGFVRAALQLIHTTPPPVHTPCSDSVWVSAWAFWGKQETDSDQDQLALGSTGHWNQNLIPILLNHLL